MKIWTEADIPVLISGVEFIRRRSDVYLGSRPWAPAIVKEMVGDLILRGAQPIRIDTAAGWWKISAGNDWLQEERIENRVEMVFKTIAQFPAKGVNAMRSEVLVGAPPASGPPQSGRMA
jgi:hypothetical protein